MCFNGCLLFVDRSLLAHRWLTVGSSLTHRWPVHRFRNLYRVPCWRRYFTRERSESHTVRRRRTMPRPTKSEKPFARWAGPAVVPIGRTGRARVLSKPVTGAHGRDRARKQSRIVALSPCAVRFSDRGSPPRVVGTIEFSFIFPIRRRSDRPNNNKSIVTYNAYARDLKHLTSDVELCWWWTIWARWPPGCCRSIRCAAASTNSSPPSPVSYSKCRASCRTKRTNSKRTNFSDGWAARVTWVSHAIVCH